MIDLVRDILLGNAAIVDKVADRVYFDVAQKKPPTPYIVFRSIDEVDTQTLLGRSGRIEARLQIDCWSQSAIEAWSLARLVASVMLAVSGTLGTWEIQSIRSDGRRGVSDDPEQGSNVGWHGVSSDFIANFAAAA